MPWRAATEMVLVMALLQLVALVTALHVGSELLLDGWSKLVISLIFCGAIIYGLWRLMCRNMSARWLWELIALAGSCAGLWIIVRAWLPLALTPLLVVMMIIVVKKYPTRAFMTLFTCIAAIGGAVLFGGRLSWFSLGLLWLGLSLYDGVASARLSWLIHWAYVALDKGWPTVARLHRPVLVSHLIFPMAWIVSASKVSISATWFIMGASWLGAWYALTRQTNTKLFTIVPWMAVWMIGAQFMIAFINQYLHLIHL